MGVKINKDTSIIKGFKAGIGFSLALLVSVFVVGLLAQSVYYFQDAQLLSAKQLNDSFSTLTNSLDTVQTVQQPPVGSIVAWNKNIRPGDPLTLPAGWLECNGQTISDTESILAGLNTPDLNTTPVGGGHAGGYYLRGYSTSGTVQGDVFRDHRHHRNTFNEPEVDIRDAAPGGTLAMGTGSWHQITAIETGFTRTPGAAGPETRPLSYTVVWIMRIK